MLIPPHILTHLPYLAEVSRTSSFTKAAHSLNLTQAALSYQIKQLEGKLGSKLIIRKPGSQVKLTAAGDKLSQEYIQCAKRLAHVLQQLDFSLNKGCLKISVPVDFGTFVMPNIITKLKNIAPELEVEIQISDEIIDLNKSEVELAIRSNTKEGVLSHEPFFCTSPCLVASKAYLVKHGHPKTLDALKDHTILLRERSKHRNWNRLLDGQSIQFSQLSKQLVLGSTIAIKEAAKLDLGIALVPEFIAREEISDLHHLKRTPS